MKGTVDIWIDLIALLPLCGAIWVWRLPDADQMRRLSLVFCGATLFCTLAAWLQFALRTDPSVTEQWSVLSRLTGATKFWRKTTSSIVAP